jgi:GAF domain-containing protein
VREVQALHPTRAGSVPDTADLELLELAADDGERQLAALATMCAVTRAQFGLLYRILDNRAVTAAAHGEHMMERLGQPLPVHDAVERFARSGQIWVGGVGEGPLGQTLRRRFEPEHEVLRGVAIVPIRAWGSVLAFVELARADHPFRVNDRKVLAAIADAVTDAASLQDPMSRD